MVDGSGALPDLVKVTFTERELLDLPYRLEAFTIRARLRHAGGDPKESIHRWTEVDTGNIVYASPRKK